jgi:hypothetical protein
VTAAVPCACGAPATGGRPPRCELCRKAAYREYHREYQVRYRRITKALGLPLRRGEGPMCVTCSKRRALAEDDLCNTCAATLRCQAFCPDQAHTHCPGPGDGSGPCGLILYAGETRCTMCQLDVGRHAA